MSSRNDRPWVFPQKAYDYAVERMRSLQVRKEIDGDKMLPGWEREYSFCAYVKGLLESLEQESLERSAAADKKGNRS